MYKPLKKFLAYTNLLWLPAGNAPLGAAHHLLDVVLVNS